MYNYCYVVNNCCCKVSPSPTPQVSACLLASAIHTHQNSPSTKALDHRSHTQATLSMLLLRFISLCAACIHHPHASHMQAFLYRIYMNTTQQTTTGSTMHYTACTATCAKRCLHVENPCPNAERWMPIYYMNNQWGTHTNNVCQHARSNVRRTCTRFNVWNCVWCKWLLLV